MWVSFLRGVIRKGSAEFRAFWAESEFGLRVRIQGESQAQSGENFEVVSGDRITSFELPGIEQGDAEFLIHKILEGHYLEKPGVAGKGDAVLYMLINEALHELERIGDQEKLD
jgi:hypothetical protein